MNKCVLCGIGIVGVPIGLCNTCGEAFYRFMRDDCNTHVGLIKWVAERALASPHNSKNQWNRCPKCNELVDLSDEVCDGTECTCSCGADCVVVCYQDEILALELVEPDEEP